MDELFVYDEETGEYVLRFTRSELLALAGAVITERKRLAGRNSRITNPSERMMVALEVGRLNGARHKVDAAATAATTALLEEGGID